MRVSAKVLLVVAIAAVGLVFGTADAQFGGLKNKLKDKVVKTVEKKTDTSTETSGSTGASSSQTNESDNSTVFTPESLDRYIAASARNPQNEARSHSNGRP
jgi:hypothetical protein